jgi:tetratricopeptide (TPR) repeat protein
VVGESPPPAPRNFFGREELIEKIVGLVENMTPIALIGTGGIGKTSIALTVLSDDRIQQRFQENRRFISCDKFTASPANFLRRLSEAIGAGIENPESFTSLRSFIASKEMLIVLDNAESILDSQRTDAQEFHNIVQELSEFKNVCLAITSRINATPSTCERLSIPPISMEAARSTFFRIHDNSKPSKLIDGILQQLDFHPLSVTLLATVAHQNGWTNDRLVKEWRQRQTGVLRTDHGRNFADTIELSIASPTFQKLGSDARALLEVIAFFPQGINEDNFHWLFPTVSGGNNILDKLCTLSLTYRSKGYVTMLAPLRDHFRLTDLKSSSLLRTTKECYFTKMSVQIEYYIQENYESSKWIKMEDANVEHLLNEFTSIEKGSNAVWDACANFMRHLHWHKQRKIVLGPKVLALPDTHPSKSLCLFELSRVLQSLGSDAERVGLLTHSLALAKKQNDLYRIGLTLLHLSDAYLELGQYEEGVKQASEALSIAEAYGTPVDKAGSLNMVAWLTYRAGRVDDAEKAANRAISLLLPEKNQELLICQSHRILGEISLAQEKKEEGIRHFKEALRIASPFSWNNHVIWIHHSLALLYSGEGKFDEAQTHIEQAESYAVGNTYFIGRAILLRAWVLYRQRKFEEARSEALRALELFKNLGATTGQGICGSVLENIDQAEKGLSISGKSDLEFQW